MTSRSLLAVVPVVVDAVLRRAGHEHNCASRNREEAESATDETRDRDGLHGAAIGDEKRLRGILRFVLPALECIDGVDPVEQFVDVSGEIVLAAQGLVLHVLEAILLLSHEFLPGYVVAWSYRLSLPVVGWTFTATMRAGKLDGYAHVAELVDALDLGSSALGRGGSSPPVRTHSHLDSELSVEEEPMTLIGLVRHGQTDWNLKNIFQGASDVPLNATGIEQAHHALDSTPPFPWDFVMSSPLIRARQTAEVIADDHQLPYLGAHEGFREVDFGWAEGVPSTEAYKAYPKRDFPGRESINAVLERACAALREISAQHPDGRILVVAHGTLIRYLMSAVAQRAFTSFPNTSLSLLDIAPTLWRVPMIAGFSLRDPFEWRHNEGAIPTIDPTWDAPHGTDPGSLPLAECPALEAYRPSTAPPHDPKESR